ncbi:hypothetical protein COI_0207 [Mannheimia haemolytica serotype A2 str. OVINE]|nr:hypothetical protein COI_0207 [Mannheimia haemolytica serotype A2 str. OVINE]
MSLPFAEFVTILPACSWLFCHVSVSIFSLPLPPLTPASKPIPKLSLSKPINTPTLAL